VTISELQSKGYTLTSGEVDALNKRILSEYKKALKASKARISRDFTKHLSTKDVSQWAVIMNKGNKLKNLRSDTHTVINKMWAKVTKLFIEGSEIAFRNNYYRQLYAVNWMLEKSSFQAVNENAVAASVLGEVNRVADAAILPKYGKLVDVLKKNKLATIQKMDSIVAQAILQGKGPAVVSREMKDLLNTSLTNATRISRTEVMRNLNSGSYTNYLTMKNKGAERHYVSTLDTRTRAQSGFLDGQVATDEGFLYPNGNRYQVIGNTGIAAYDINDRCSEVTIIDEQSPDMRSGRNPSTGKTELISYVNFPQWMKQNGLKRLPSGKIVSK